jgi:Ser/Thr protein kinase RdoA (MazF antagonist)
VSEVTASGQTWLAIMSRYEAGTHPNTYSPALLADIARVQGQIHEAGMAFATSQKQLSGQLERPSLRSSLLPSMPTGVSHFDYDGSNILVKGDQVSCVVDFESMRQDPFVVDIFFTLTCLYDLLRDKSKLETYLRSYETVRKLGWLEKPVLRLVLAMRYHSPKLLLLSY